MLRKYVIQNLDNIEVLIEYLKSGFFSCEFADMITERTLSILLVTTDTERGRGLFIRVLEYAKTRSPELADRYWHLYDSGEDINNVITYTITIEPSQ